MSDSVSGLESGGRYAISMRLVALPLFGGLRSATAASGQPWKLSPSGVAFLARQPRYSSNLFYLQGVIRLRVGLVIKIFSG